MKKEVLFNAIKRNDLKKVEERLRMGQNPNIRNELGMTPLMLASLGGFTEIVKFLLTFTIPYRTPAQINMRGRNGNTALMEAIVGGHIETIKILLKHGQSLVNIQDDNGSTALIKSIEEGRIDIVKLILKSNADVNIQNKWGHSALSLAIHGGCIDVIKALLKRYCSVTDQDIHKSITEGNIQITKLLIDHYKGYIDKIYNFVSQRKEPYILYLLTKGNDNIDLTEMFSDANLIKKFIIDSITCSDIASLKFIKEKLNIQLCKVTDENKNTLLGISAKHSDDLSLIKYIYETVKGEFENNESSLINYFIKWNNDKKIALDVAFDAGNITVAKYLYDILKELEK